MLRFLPVLLFAAPLLAQTPPEVAMERAGYVDWLKKAPNSPLAALAQQRVGAGLRLGPAESDIPLSGIEEHRVSANGAALVLQGPEGERPVSRGRPVRVGNYTLYFTGSPPATVVTVFGDSARKQPPGYFDYDPAMVFTGMLHRSGTREKTRILTADGIEVEASEVGTFIVSLGGGARLRVLRIPVGGGDESELEIFFQDETNGHGTYPAGRFVSLVPLSGNQFRLDFNRARNPFCAYNTVYACPVPWRGNTIPAPIRAGERYAGGGLEAVPAENENQ